MDESLKRRLVGATVLVSLIVIFVPMLLEDESGQPPEIEGSNIPPRPEPESGFVSSRILPLEDEPLAPPSGVPDLPEPEAAGTQPAPVPPDRPSVWRAPAEPQGEPDPEAESALADEPIPATSESESLPPAPEPEREPPGRASVAAPPGSLLPDPEESEQPPPGEPSPPEPTTTALVKPAPQPLEPRPVKAPTRPPAEQPRAASRPEAAPAKPTVTTWAVQVGSFSDRANADKLVEELRAARYPAFQERTEVKGSTLYRVRVGPEEDRELADAIAAGIDKRFKLNGQVVSYP